MGHIEPLALPSRRQKCVVPLMLALSGPLTLPCVATPWHRNLCQPDEVTEYPRAMTEVVTRSGFTIKRSTFRPGWRWSDQAAEPSCREPHTGYLVSGRLGVLM
jgi:hypothetical protein